MPPELSVVRPGTAEPSRLERIKALQEQARGLAREEISALTAAMTDVAERASGISAGGDVFPPGVRELCARMVEEIEARVQTLEAIISRVM